MEQISSQYISGGTYMNDVERVSLTQDQVLVLLGMVAQHLPVLYMIERSGQPVTVTGGAMLFIHRHDGEQWRELVGSQEEILVALSQLEARPTLGQSDCPCVDHAPNITSVRLL